MTGEEAEEAAGFERHRAAEIEEEGRRHTSLESEAERAARDAHEAQKKVVKGLNWDEERKKRGRKRDDDDDEDGEAAAEAAQEAKKQGFVAEDGAQKYFQDMPEDRMGDLSLSDPNEMKRALGPSVRFAQHAMLLAAERMREGASRDDGLQLLATLYAGVGDRQYANKALREFGHATGIIDLYPLELMEHLLVHVPGFCTKVKRGRFFRKAVEKEKYETQVGVPIVLEYDPALRIRGFAIKGGAQPGYLFEPTEPPGTYQLVMLRPGTFTVLISAISKDAWLLIEELEVEVADSEGIAFDDITGLRREREHAAAEVESPKEKKDKPDDLKIHFPKRI